MVFHSHVDRAAAAVGIDAARNFSLQLVTSDAVILDAEAVAAPVPAKRTGRVQSSESRTTTEPFYSAAAAESSDDDDHSEDAAAETDSLRVEAAELYTCPSCANKYDGNSQCMCSHTEEYHYVVVLQSDPDANHVIPFLPDTRDADLDAALAKLPNANDASIFDFGADHTKACAFAADPVSFSVPDQL